MAGTVNEEFFDALVRHQIYLLRLSQSIRKDIEKLLDATERDLREEITRRLARSTDGLTPANLKRLQVLERVIKETRYKAWDQIDALWVQHMRDIATEEPKTLAGILQTVLPVTIETVLPAAPLLKALVETYPFEGRVLKDWANGVRQADLNRIMSQVRIGMVQGETSQQIARRVVGTVQTRGANGVTEITRRDAAAITRTAVNAFSNAAKQQFYQANSAFFEMELYVATLDSRTTAVCRANDGKQFPIGEGPIPPLHYQCRSLRVAVINGQVIGDRPMKAATEQMMLRRYAQEAGIKTPRSRADLPFGHKGSFDSFARGQVRSLTGQVPAATSYQTWLERQSAEFVNDVLGPTRAALFRQGKLPLDKFVNRAGDELNLRQLAQQHRDAFVAAGLNPEDFL